MFRTIPHWLGVLAAAAALATTTLTFAQDAQFRGRIKTASTKHITVATGRDPGVKIMIVEQTAITVGGVPVPANRLKPGYRVRVEAVWSEFGRNLEAVTIQASH